MNPNLVILAGGISSRMKRESVAVEPRLRAEAASKSKAMISFGDRPFLDYLLSNAQAAGVKHVVVLTGERDGSIVDYYESQRHADAFPRLNISYAVQPIPSGREKPLGTADALIHALRTVPHWRGRSFLVCNSDNLYSVRALGALLLDEHPHALIDYDRAALRFDESRIAAFAVLKRSPEGYLTEIVEKPSLDELRRAADASGRIGVSMNLFKFSYDAVVPALEATPVHPVRHEQELPETVRLLIRANARAVFALPMSEHVPDLTSPEDILRVREELNIPISQVNP